MRKDFSKLLTESPRDKSWVKYRSARTGVKLSTQDDDQAGFKVGMKRAHIEHSFCTRSFNENLSPLRRFLQSRVGCLWDDVYSEIKTQFPNTSTINNHIYQHLFDYVETHTSMKEGQVVCFIKYSPKGFISVNALGNDSWYVHPETKLLCKPDTLVKQDFKIKRQTFLDQYLRVLSPTQQLRRLNGFWYLVEFKEKTHPRKVYNWFERFTFKEWSAFSEDEKEKQRVSFYLLPTYVAVKADFEEAFYNQYDKRLFEINYKKKINTSPRRNNSHILN